MFRETVDSNGPLREAPLFDHVLAVAFSIGFPLVTGPIYARRRAALRAGDPVVRRREYLETITWLLAMGVAPVLLWLLSDRALATLGLGFEASWQQSTALVVSLVLSVLLFLQVRGIRRDPAMREAALKAIASVREYMPLTHREAQLFRGVSISAGVGEEIYYRGFLLLYLSQYLSLTWAVVVSSALFGLAHVMHGVQATVRATLMGFVLAGLYLFGGSLWASMLLHIAVDLSSGEAWAAASLDAPAAELRPPRH